jgi:hypothetical protein
VDGVEGPYPAKTTSEQVDELSSRHTPSIDLSLFRELQSGQPFPLSWLLCSSVEQTRAFHVKFAGPGGVLVEKLPGKGQKKTN